MPVYVDDMEASYGRMVMCHMVADTTAELVAMAVTIGVNVKWIQKAGTYQEHFDIAKSKRALAIKHGAKMVDRYGLGEILKRKRQAAIERASATEGETE